MLIPRIPMKPSRSRTKVVNDEDLLTHWNDGWNMDSACFILLGRTPRPHARRHVRDSRMRSVRMRIASARTVLTSARRIGWLVLQAIHILCAWSSIQKMPRANIHKHDMDQTLLTLNAAVRTCRLSLSVRG